MIDILNTMTQSPFMAAWIFIKYLGPPIFLILGFLGGRILWLDWRQGINAASKEYVLLAIDIPKENEQSPKAIENMFDQISGAYSGIDFVDKWWYGKFQSKFAFEIISIDGYIQFLIHMEKGFRDLVEASVYAQYPDAEITEVDDYTDNSPDEFPNDKYDLWGTEFIQTNSHVYPMQTYPFFEHMMTKEFKDPMAALMEIFGSLRMGENIWIQYVLTLTDDGWTRACDGEINKILGKHKNPTFFDKFFGLFSSWLSELSRQVTGVDHSGQSVTASSDPIMFKLSPGEIERIKAIELKKSKTGYAVKMRMVYFAPNEVYSPSRSVAATVGALKQFAGPYNGLRPESKFTRTKKFYTFPKTRLRNRQNGILKAYKERSNTLGIINSFILNAEELATLFHFPISTAVKSPLLKRVEAKKAEPPINLPS